MIILNNFNETIKYFKSEKEIINYNIQIQENFKSIILKYMQNFADSTVNIELPSVDQVLNFLENLKLALNLCNDNIESFRSISTDIKKIISSSYNHDENLLDKINSFNQKYTELNNSTMQNTIKIESCLYSIAQKSELKFIFQEVPNSDIASSNITIIKKANDIMSTINTIDNTSDDNTSTDEVKDMNISNDKETIKVDIPKKAVAADTIDDSKSKPKKIPFNPTNEKYLEDTLIVSQTAGNVILPYQLIKLNELLEENPEKYSSIDDVINKNYTLPISVFKNPFLSRFRESFKLMRNKENSSIANSFERGMELMFNYNLHPAIISACSNVDELDRYLDYLENGETEKFKCFNIIFDIPPATTKNKH